DRGAAAERRATTIAGTVAIAASFTLSGAALVLDEQKITGAFSRSAFAIVLVATTLMFVLSAYYALRAFVRQWNWNTPHDLHEVSRETAVNHEQAMRAARLLKDFAGNWEIADL